MGFKYLPIIVILSCFLFPLHGSSKSNNIAQELSDGQYAIFLNLLNQTKLVDEINKQSAVTILAVDNGAASALSAKPLSIVKNILSVHIIVDLYDDVKIKQIKKDNESVQVTTLFQSTGVAQQGQGFVNLVPLPNNELGIESAVKGSQPDVRYIEKLNKESTSIAVLHVSGVIQVPEIESINATTTPPSPPSPKNALAPQSSTKNASTPGDDASSNGLSTGSGAPTTHSPVEDISPSPSKSSSLLFISGILVNTFIVGLVGISINF